MKKFLTLLLALMLVLSLAACQSNSSESQMSESKPDEETASAETTEPTEGTDESAESTESTEGTDSADAPLDSVQDTEDTEGTEGDIMKITVGDTVLTVTLADNSSTEALKELLKEGPLTIDMSDYGNMEKVGPIGTSLPTNDEHISTEAGDVILYQGNSLVIYYDTNTWNFTRLGKIENVTGAELLEVLGNGSVTVTLSLE